MGVRRVRPRRHPRPPAKHIWAILAALAEVVRTSIGPDARLPTRRALDERFFIRWPGAYAALANAVNRLPLRSRLRRALLRRNVLSVWAAWARWDVDAALVRRAPDAHLEIQAR
jgi:hypothetical protein